MIKYREMIQILSNKIIEDDLPHGNTVIIGENSVGKTSLLKAVNDKMERSVFIDLPFDKKHIENIDESMDIVLLDNLETILEYRDILNIMSYLDSKFKGNKVVIATNNLELASSLKDFNIICLYDGVYAFCDGNDINTYNDVRLLFNRDNPVDIWLSTLLSFAICNKWTFNEESLLNRIKGGYLTKLQELVVCEIENCLIKE